MDKVRLFAITPNFSKIKRSEKNTNSTNYIQQQNNKIVPLTGFSDSLKAQFIPKKIDINNVKRPTANQVLQEVRDQALSSLNEYFNLIKDKRIRNLCKKIYESTPPEYFALSSTVHPPNIPKNHPKDELGAGGLIRHIKRAVIMTFWIAEEKGLAKNSKMRDLAIAGALLHDTPYKDSLHAINNAKKAEKVMNEMGCFKQDEKELLCASIGFHMGKYTDYNNDPEWLNKFKKYQDHPLVKSVHEGDHYASRPNIYIDYTDLSEITLRINKIDKDKKEH